MNRTRPTRHRLAKSLLIAVAALVVGPPPASAADPFHARSDIAIDMAPKALAAVDAERGSFAVAGPAGVKLYQRDGKRFRVASSRPTQSPVNTVAATGHGGRQLLAYAIAGERAIHTTQVTSRGILGVDNSIELEGRPRRIVDFGGGFVVVHSQGVAFVERTGESFSSRKLTHIGSAVDAAVTDIDGDRRADLVLADEPLGEVVVLRDAFGGDPKITTMRTQRAPRRIVVADIDGDGDGEIVVLGAIGLSVHEIADDGSLQPERALVDDSHLAGLVAGDLDRDGIADLIYTNRSRTSVSTLLGSRGRRMRPGPSFLTGKAPGEVLVTPLTTQDRPDILVANEIGKSVTHIAHDRRGLHGVAMLVGGIGRLAGAASADFDGDGNLDLALTSDKSGRLEVHLGAGNGTFVAQPSYPIGMSPGSLVAGDWDGDGNPDLAVVDFGQDNVAILYGNGRGGFSVPTTIAVGVGPITVIHGDFGGPIGSDLAVANKLSDSVSILHGDRSGKFHPGPNIPVGPRPDMLLWGDVDEDGQIDLIVANEHYETITVVPRRGHALGEPYTKVLGDEPVSPATIDLKSGGPPELVVVHPAEGTVEVLHIAKGKMKALQTIAVGRAPSFVEVGDFDGDGRDDLAVVHAAAGTIAIFLQLGE